MTLAPPRRPALLRECSARRPFYRPIPVWSSIRTDFARALWENPQTLKTVNARTPLGRIGEVDEIAGAAVYLASKAGSFTTGQAIVVDGGATITG